MNKQLVCGDIGGTKTILHAAEINNGMVRELFTHRYDNHKFATFSEILQDFLNRTRNTNRLLSACFAVAGPVVAQQAQLTNLPWQISSSDISAELATVIHKALAKEPSARFADVDAFRQALKPFAG